jgi:serine/threonine protein kinase/Tol biopolymer transport system component
MRAERWQKIESIFHKALDAEEGRRGAVLEESCAGDEALRREVESLLAQHHNPGNFIEVPGFEGRPKTVYKPSLSSQTQKNLEGTLLAQYRVLEEIGVGGMGVVYKAEDTKLGRAVALKFLPQELIVDDLALERFRREARAASALNHPNICTIYDIVEQSGHAFIAMEYLEGETLAGSIHGRALGNDRIAKFGVAIAEALGAAHARGVIHRDVKPSNIFVTTSGLLKVLDFGVAKWLRSSNESTATDLTRTDGVTGTVPYMSPEQLRGQDVDGRSDIYSLGVVLYEMSTGRRPYPGTVQSELIDAILNRPASPPGNINPQLPPKLEEIILKCLEKDPEDRYQTAKEIAVDIRRMSAPSGTTRPAVTTATTALRRWGILGASLLLGALTLLAVTAFLFYKGRHAPASPTQRTLTRLTFDDGLQIGATWSPDARFIAYSSDRGGKFDIWVQQVSGGDPIQITKGAGHHWQPDWSPDGKYIAYRSEDGEGGLFIVPALGGAGLERKIASVGYHPRWSPDSSQILFDAQFTPLYPEYRFYVTRLDGSPPRQVLAEFLAQYRLAPLSAVWYPDGKRLSVWAWETAEVLTSDQRPAAWTVPLDGGVAIKSEIDPAMKEEFEKVAIGAGAEFSIGTPNFSWGVSGKAIYFDQAFRGARNIWKMTIDPATLRATGIERLTAGPGPDTGAVVSPDGKRLAFTAQSEHIRSLLFAFDATAGHITSSGQAVTSPGMTAFEENLSRDGKKIAFCVVRAGKWELWEKSLVDGREAPVIIDDDRRIYPQWSPDGRHLIYTRQKSQAEESQIMMWSVENRTEEPITAPGKIVPLVYDWSSDGKELLISQYNSEAQRWEVWRLPVAAAPHADTAARKIISNPAYDVWQPHFSTDGRWIVFQVTTSVPKALEGTLYVMSAAGGPWIRITDGKHWDDKPRWSPDGKTIYFVSRRGGFFNVWGRRFDPTYGQPVRKEFRVTAFERPSLMVPQQIAPVALSLTQSRLVLTTSEVSGSIWALDNVDQ